MNPPLSASLVRPFYSLETVWSAGIAVSEYESNSSFFERESKIFSYPVSTRKFRCGGSAAVLVHNGTALRLDVRILLPHFLENPVPEIPLEPHGVALVAHYELSEPVCDFCSSGRSARGALRTFPMAFLGRAPMTVKIFGHL